MYYRSTKNVKPEAPDETDDAYTSDRAGPCSTDRRLAPRRAGFACQIGGGAADAEGRGRAQGQGKTEIIPTPPSTTITRPLRRVSMSDMTSPSARYCMLP